MGVLLKDEQLIDDALNQYYWHIKYLQDPESGLYYHGGDQHPEEEQCHQPGQALFHALEHALVQVFFAGQAAQLCVIVAHLVIDQFDEDRKSTRLNSSHAT